jgi:hypothetical protein
MIQAHYKAAHG